MGQFARYLSCLYTNGRRKRNREVLIEDYDKTGIIEDLSYKLH